MTCIGLIELVINYDNWQQVALMCGGKYYVRVSRVDGGDVICVYSGQRVAPRTPPRGQLCLPRTPLYQTVKRGCFYECNPLRLHRQKVTKHHKSGNRRFLHAKIGWRWFIKSRIKRAPTHQSDDRLVITGVG